MGRRQALEEAGGRIQTSLRLPTALFRRFRDRLESRHQNMNSVFEAMVATWLEDEHVLSSSTSQRGEQSPDPFDGDPDHWRREDLLKAFMRWIPAAFVVKELHGRLLSANERFCELIGRRNVVGLRAKDYVLSGTADVINRHDKRVLDTKRAVVCAEYLTLNGVNRRRISVRFPIGSEKGVELIAALGFEVDGYLEHVQSVLRLRAGLPRAIRLPMSTTQVADGSDAFNSDDLLKAFIESLPAIAVVKDPEGRMRCANKAYRDVTGKRRRDVLGKTALENWPPEIGRAIVVNDRFVCETQSPYLCVDTIVVPDSPAGVDRLNIRFPIFNSRRSLVLTGTFSIECSTILEALKKFDKLTEAPSGMVVEP